MLNKCNIIDTLSKLITYNHCKNKFQLIKKNKNAIFFQCMQQTN